MDIVNAVQAVGQQFSCHIEMTQISFRIIPAGIAGAVGVNRISIVFKLRICDIQGSVPSKKLTVSGVPGGHHAVEHNI